MRRKKGGRVDFIHDVNEYAHENQTRTCICYIKPFLSISLLFYFLFIVLLDKIQKQGTNTELHSRSANT